MLSADFCKSIDKLSGTDGHFLDKDKSLSGLRGTVWKFGGHYKSCRRPMPYVLKLVEFLQRVGSSSVALLFILASY